ncbi:hypothetical protein LB543_33265 [Mesorhizobium sp. ESP7-2]|nr:hypothetical protein [Mesorhizobium sp. ESP7-2]
MAEEQRHYQDPIQAQLGERVTNLGRRQTDLEAEMCSGFRQIEQSFSWFTNETRNSIAALGTSISERWRDGVRDRGSGRVNLLADPGIDRRPEGLENRDRRLRQGCSGPRLG